VRSAGVPPYQVNAELMSLAVPERRLSCTVFRQTRGRKLRPKFSTAHNPSSSINLKSHVRAEGHSAYSVQSCDALIVSRRIFFAGAQHHCASALATPRPREEL